MSAATLISRLLGFARDMVIAFYLGATGVADAFFVSFRIPNLLRELFAEGAMSSAFIPVMSEYQNKEGKQGANRLARIAFTFLLVAVGAVTVAGILAAPAIVRVVAPGFISDPGKFSLTVSLTRIMFPFLLFVSLGALLMGALNTRGVFFIPALSPAVLNVVIIGFMVALATTQGPTAAAAIGVLVGGFMQFACQIPSYLRAGYDFRPAPEFRDPGLKKMMQLILPVTAALAVGQVNIVVSNILASFLPEGSITYLFYSMRLIHFPIGVFGVAMGLAVLPALSGHAQKGDLTSLRQDFSFALRVLFFLSLPSMAGLIALREPIVSTLFMRGKFDYLAVAGTSDALLFYSVGIWAMVGVRVLTSTFYAFQDTKNPVRAAIAAFAANLVLSVLLMGPMRHSGLALANSLAAMTNFGLLFYFLRKKLGRLDGRRISASAMKIALASAVMAGAGYFATRSGIWQQKGLYLEKALGLSGGIALCVGIYALVCYFLKSEEMGFIIEAAKKRFSSSPGRN